MFFDAVPKHEVPVILSNSSAFIFHLKNTDVFKYGISSNKLFDYLAGAKPLIFAVNTSYDFAKEAKCGISIEPDNPKKLFDAMLD